MGDVNGLVANSVVVDAVATGTPAAGSAVGRDGRHVDSVLESIRKDKAVSTIQLQAVGVQLSGESQLVARKRKELALARKNEEINFVERLRKNQERVTDKGRLAFAKLGNRLEKLLLDKKQLKASLGLSLISTSEAAFALKFLKTETTVEVPTLKSGAEKRSFVERIFGEQPELEIRFLEWKATLQELGTARVARNLEAITLEDATPEQPPQTQPDASEQPVALPDATRFSSKDEYFDAISDAIPMILGTIVNLDEYAAKADALRLQCVKNWYALHPVADASNPQAIADASETTTAQTQPVADATPEQPTKGKGKRGKKQPA